MLKQILRTKLKTKLVNLLKLITMYFYKRITFKKLFLLKYY